MSDVDVWREGDAKEPKFPNDFDVLQKAVLQVTDIKTNRNKYYAVELHQAKTKYRVYTHYGRTDDLNSNPNAGARESRYFSSLPDAQGCYNKIYKQKTSATKGYKEISLASSKIGSHHSVGKSSGEIDNETLKKMSDVKSDVVKAPTIILAKSIQELVSYLYAEATNALTTTINATITANGIETPLGVLTIGQIEKGQQVLDDMISFIDKKKSLDKLTELSGDFYTLIPHRFGRSKEAAQLAIIDTADKLNEKQDTLQLMRDMLSVNSKGNVLVNPEIDQKYKALNCDIESVTDSIFKEMKQYVEKSVVKKYNKFQVTNIWKINRPDEQKNFTSKIDNHKLLFHGSASKNWVGILSRGLLLPKIVVKLGVHRTDAGWLGNGIYFGDAACTSYNYAHPGKRNTRFITVANVALGKMKDFSKITYGLSGPPDGYDSCHGVRGTQFADDEYVVYEHNQQKLEYLIECK